MRRRLDLPMGLLGLGVSRLLWICSGDKSVFPHHTSGSFFKFFLFFFGGGGINEGNGKSEIVKREIAY
jgi:hypothetical protein